MIFGKENGRACPEFEARLEDHVAAMRAAGLIPADSDLAVHLAACGRCRRALDDAEAASALLLKGRREPDENLLGAPFFSSRVMARIRGYEAARAAGGEFWPQLEVLSLRLSAAALSLAVVLGVWAAWQRQASTASAPESARVRVVSPEVRPVDTRYLFPEMKRPPANAGEAMMVLASTENGRQR